MQRQQISRSSSSEQLTPRMLIHPAENTLPVGITPSSAENTSYTQTSGESSVTMSSKSIPSFAETQLLSVYYPSQNPANPLPNDKCIFVEQQNRQPVRFRTAYDPTTPSRFTQTSPPAPLSTLGSTVVIDGNSDSEQYFKLRPEGQHTSTNELLEQSRYTYEKYIRDSKENHTRTSSSSSSSVTTVIAQNDGHNSENNSSSNQRLSNWLPTPHDTENDLQRPSRVQFAEKLVRVIPISTTNSLTEDVPISTPPVLPRTKVNEPSHPINQSKWIQTHMDNSEVQNSSKVNSVNTLRTLFEQQDNQSTRLMHSNRTIEPEEKSSKHGVEIRFRINEPTIHRAEPAKIITVSTGPFTLEQIQQITGKQFQNFDQIGRYLPDGYTWQWDEVFWLSLTTSQRDQLKDLEQRLLSRQNSFDSSLSSSTETKRFKSTFKTTGAGTRPQNKNPSVLTKYTEVNTIDATEPSMSAFGSSPTVRVDAEESKRTDSQTTIIESGYNSADDHQKFRRHSDPVIDPSPRKLDPLSYEHFLVDYLSTHAEHRRATDGTLIISIDEQQIPLPNVHLPSSKENVILAKKIYLDAINRDFSPFETESDQLVIFLGKEIVLLPAHRWLSYRKKYHHAKWVNELKRVNRTIPSQLIPIIEQWLSEHATLELSTSEIHVDGITIPVIGRFDQLKDWTGVLKYLIRIGLVSYDANGKLIQIANSELDAQRLLRSPTNDLVERLAEHLRALDIHFHTENGTLIIQEEFNIPKEYVENLFRQHQEGEDLNSKELANLLLHICQIEEEREILMLTFDNQILRLINEDQRQFLTEWLEELNEQKFINITEENDILIYPHHPSQQIFIKHEHVHTYMHTKRREVVNMNDIAQILILYNYVQYSHGQLCYRNQVIQLASDSVEDSNEHELLSSHIRQIHIDKENQEINIEFTHDPDHYLQLPSHWYEEISRHQFDRSYIIVKLLNNGGIIQDDTFLFNDHSYALKISSEQKEKLIDYYVESINDQGGIKSDNVQNLLLLENSLDGSELYLTEEHTRFIRQNNYRREDMKSLLNQHGQIRTDEFGNWLLYYNNQCIQLPSIEQVHITHSELPTHRPRSTDANLQLLFPSNRSLRLIQKTPSTTTLDIEQPNEQNEYAVDPLLILANYVHRTGTLYQDEFGRLVIKLNRDEIVVPRHQAANSILEINTAPNRTGTIIARLINRLGKVQSNRSGGIIITIGKGSLQLTKEVIDESKVTLNSTYNSASVLPSRSSESLASDSLRKSRSQASLTIKPRLLIVRDDEATRFYLQHTYEEDRRSNSVMMLPRHHPVQPTQPRLIAPEYYRDMTLRDASVHVRQEGRKEISYENLAQYLSTNQRDLSSSAVRRMLKFTSRDEYFAYLHNQISANQAEELVRASEERSNQIRSRTPDREIEGNERQRGRSPGAFYNVANGRRSNESVQQSASSSSLSSDMLISRSPQTSNAQSLTTPEKNITLPRSTTLSGQSNDGESESRTTVSRSVSAAAKVATSKSDTIKSTTSSSGASSREYSSVSVTRTHSLISPNRTSGSKGGGGDEVKKEKKSKFRTPSFLRKRKEKKEAVNKEKADK